MTDGEYLRRAARRSALMDYIGAAMALVALLLCLTAWGYSLSWHYDECISVGHSETYCAASTAGCFGGGRR